MKKPHEDSFLLDPAAMPVVSDRLLRTVRWCLAGMAVLFTTLYYLLRGTAV
jgi:hypothetical protein